MKLTTKWITLTLVISVGIYALSPGPKHLADNPTGWELREQLVFLTGITALTLMVLCMIIPVRNPVVNRQMNGLDKAYVVHKWAGIFTTLAGTLHWMTEKVPHWLVASGFVANPGELNDGSGFSDLEIALFQSGTLLIEFVFYIMIALVFIAVFKKIPYHVFRKSHKIFPVIFLLIAYHGATAQLKERWLATPAGYLVLLLAVIGTLAALASLFRRIGASRTTTAHIKSLELHANGIVDIQLSTGQKTFNHKSGQFAFLHFAHNPEPHPFSITSSGLDPHQLRFSIKALGDFTSGLKENLEIGQTVQVEGPYGEFLFDKPGKRQIWVAAGIGITPFISRLEYLCHKPEARLPTNLWYCSRHQHFGDFSESLNDLCLKSGVTLHRINTSENQYLTAKMLHENIADFDDVSIWFCGPATFGKSLLKTLKTYGLHESRFHYDSFEMR